MGAKSWYFVVEAKSNIKWKMACYYFCLIKFLKLEYQKAKQNYWGVRVSRFRFWEDAEKAHEPIIIKPI